MKHQLKLILVISKFSLGQIISVFLENPLKENNIQKFLYESKIKINLKF